MKYTNPGLISRLLLTFATIVLSLSALNTSAQSVAEANPDKSFAIRFTTGPNWNHNLQYHEQEFFQEHSANLRRLRSDGNIVFGARYGEVGLIVLSAKTKDEARAMIELDPSVKAGIFNYRIDEFSVFYDWKVLQD